MYAPDVSEKRVALWLIVNLERDVSQPFPVCQLLLCHLWRNPDWIISKILQIMGRNVIPWKINNLEIEKSNSLAKSKYLPIIKHLKIRKTFVNRKCEVAWKKFILWQNYITDARFSQLSPQLQAVRYKNKILLFYSIEDITVNLSDINISWTDIDVSVPDGLVHPGCCSLKR